MRDGGGLKQRVDGVDDTGRFTAPKNIMGMGQIGEKIRDHIFGTDAQVMKKIRRARYMGQQFRIRYRHGLVVLVPG